MLKHFITKVLANLVVSNIKDTDSLYSRSFFKFIIPVLPNSYILSTYAINTQVLAHLKSYDVVKDAIIDDMPKFGRNSKVFVKKLVKRLVKKLKNTKYIKIKKVSSLLEAKYKVLIFLYYKKEPYIVSVTDSGGIWCNSPKRKIKYKTELRMLLKNLVYDDLCNNLVINDKIKNILNVLVTYVNTRHLLPIPKFVVLLYGPPGTGKTTLAKLLKALLSLQIKDSLVINSFVQDKLEHLFHEHKTIEEPSLLTTDTTRDYNNVLFEIVDEFDSYIALKGDIALKARRNTGIIKQVLDQVQDIVILITNHIDSIDDAVLREGRINLKVEVADDFYSVADKKRILKIFAKTFKIKENDVLYKELMSLNFEKETIATLLNNAQKLVYKKYTYDFFNIDPVMDKKIDEYFSANTNSKGVELLTLTNKDSLANIIDTLENKVNTLFNDTGL